MSMSVGALNPRSRTESDSDTSRANSFPVFDVANKVGVEFHEIRNVPIKLLRIHELYGEQTESKL